MELNNDGKIKAIGKEHPLALVYFSQPNCSICVADKPRARQLAEKYNVPFLTIDTVEEPATAAYFSVMTVPVVLVIANGKEVHREARIIDFRRLEKQLERYRTALTVESKRMSYASLFDQLDPKQ
ncbi:hypothetical protein A5886_002495 [Enterococcus sp. 8G7_MSG3316]|uniref:Thioredoxin domain-containing protein n=1 Tax=Candidatus Enterococcus testudinis TaxID=1834191 RepID=A0A242A8N5_9ENTE|nr:thioredoxin family protein [Enterococcus sp. 8G7_MSG3316]OTN77395.1 hypothetical protein A5886_002495 [Enterococcus sp. 8G7_MSG3316]